MDSDRLMLQRMLICILLGSASGCTQKFACGIPWGRKCESLSAVYASYATDRLPLSSAVPGPGEVVQEPRARAVPQPAAVPVTLTPHWPSLTRPRHVRVWIDRWEDADGDLHDETYLYLRLDRGNWSVRRQEAGEEDGP